MGIAEQRKKDSAMASFLKSKGIFHGKRTTSPRPNSGGLTLSKGPGSSKYQRLMEARRQSN